METTEPTREDYIREARKLKVRQAMGILLQMDPLVTPDELASLDELGWSALAKCIKRVGFSATSRRMLIDRYSRWYVQEEAE